MTKLSLAVLFSILTWLTTVSTHAAEIKSPAGYTASWQYLEEGHAEMTLKLNGKIISTIDGARPVSFSPDGKILLVREAQQDDDCRHYLLNLAKGEYEKDWIPGTELRIGGRYVTEAIWSSDGKTLTLKNAEFVGGSITIDVNMHCRQ